MAMQDLPVCWCPPADMQACDWDFHIEIGYSRQNDEPGPGSKLVWNLTDMPQPLVQMMFHAAIDALNESNIGIYLSWLEQCYGPDSEPAKMLRSIAGEK